MNQLLDRMLAHVSAPSRVLIALVFVLSGVGKTQAFAATQDYMAAAGLPGALLAPVIVFEVAAGLAIAVGAYTRIAALALAGFTLFSAILFHSAFGDQVQLIMFLKNLAMTGGLLLLAKHGAGSFSVDARMRAAKQATP